MTPATTNKRNRVSTNLIFYLVGLVNCTKSLENVLPCASEIRTWNFLHHSEDSICLQILQYHQIMRCKELQNKPMGLERQLSGQGHCLPLQSCLGSIPRPHVVSYCHGELQFWIRK